MTLALAPALALVHSTGSGISSDYDTGSGSGTGCGTVSGSGTLWDCIWYWLWHWHWIWHWIFTWLWACIRFCKKLSLFFQFVRNVNDRTKVIAPYTRTSFRYPTHRQHHEVFPIPPLHPFPKVPWYDKVRYNTQDLVSLQRSTFKGDPRLDRIVVFG